MVTVPQLLSLAMSLLILALIAVMLRRRKLREKYVFLWILVGLAGLIFSVWPAGPTVVSKYLGFRVASNFLFFVEAGLLLFISIQFSVEVSRLESRTEQLAEEVALLKLDAESSRDTQDGAS